MEILKISEKSQVKTNQFVPTVIGNNTGIVAKAYKEDQYNINYENIIITRKKSKVFSSFVVAILIFIMGFFGLKILTEKNEIFGTELAIVTSRLFVPKDFGKIKFVSGDNITNEHEAFSCMMSLSVPFSVCLATKNGDDLVVTSAGEIIVKCAMDGVVESVKTDEKTYKKTVVVSHKYDIKTTYFMLDNLSVKAGDKVTRNSPLGIAQNNQIGFKVTYKNAIVKGLEIIDGELTFS